MKFLSTRDLLFGQKKLSFTGTGFKPTFLEISFIIQRESNIQIKIWLFIVIYYNIFQFFLQKRYFEADIVMKVSCKIALHNVVFHQLPLIQHCSIFYKKKMSFRVPKFLGEFNDKICSECISYNLEFLPPTYQRGRKPPSRALTHLRLRCSVRASGTQLSPYFINWDSYFNSFWEPWYIQW